MRRRAALATFAAGIEANPIVVARGDIFVGLPISAELALRVDRFVG